MVNNLNYVPMYKLTKHPSVSNFYNDKKVCKSGSELDFSDENYGIIVGSKFSTGEYLVGIDFDIYDFLTANKKFIKKLSNKIIKTKEERAEYRDYIDSLESLDYKKIALDLGLAEEELKIENFDQQLVREKALNKVCKLLKLDRASIPFVKTATNGIHLYVKSAENFADTFRKNCFKVPFEGQYIDIYFRLRMFCSPGCIVEGKDGVVREYSWVNGKCYDDIPTVSAEQMANLLNESDEFKKRDAVKVAKTSAKKTGGRKRATVERLLEKSESFYTKLFAECGIEFYRGGTYSKISCPFHAPDDNFSFIVYDNGACFDGHDSKMYNFENIMNKLNINYSKYLQLKNLDFRAPSDKEKERIVNGYGLRYYSTQKSIGDVLRVDYDDILKYDKYILDNPENEVKIKNIIESKKKEILIAAPTGSGKTTTLIKMVEKSKYKIIMVVPLVQLAKQIAKQYNMVCVVGNADQDDIDRDLGYYENIVCTYDSLQRVIGMFPGKGLKNYIVIIDEFHNFQSSLSYREKAIALVKNNQERFNKSICLSGTPEGMFPQNMLNGSLVKIKCEPFIAPQKPKTIVYTAKKTRGAFEQLVLKHIILEKDRSKKTIVYAKSKSLLRKLQHAIIETVPYFNKFNTVVLTSQNKEHHVFKSLEEQSLIPEIVEVIFTTNVIAEGINILNDDIGHVFMYDQSLDLITLRQFFARFRKNKHTNHILIKGDCDGIPTLDINKAIAKNGAISMELINRVKETFGDSLSYKGLKNSFSGQERITLNSIIADLDIRYGHLRVEWINKLHSLCYRDAKKLGEYLKFTENIDIEITHLDEEKKLIDDKSDEFAIKEEKKIAEIAKICLEPQRLPKSSYNDLDAYLAGYVKFCMPGIKQSYKRQLVKSFSFEDLKSFHRKYKSLYSSDKDVEKIIKLTTQESMPVSLAAKVVLKAKSSFFKIENRLFNIINRQFNKDYSIVSKHVGGTTKVYDNFRIYLEENIDTKFNFYSKELDDIIKGYEHYSLLKQLKSSRQIMMQLHDVFETSKTKKDGEFAWKIKNVWSVENFDSMLSESFTKNEKNLFLKWHEKAVKKCLNVFLSDLYENNKRNFFDIFKGLRATKTLSESNKHLYNTLVAKLAKPGTTGLFADLQDALALGQIDVSMLYYYSKLAFPEEQNYFDEYLEEGEIMLKAKMGQTT